MQAMIYRHLPKEIGQPLHDGRSFTARSGTDRAKG
jgi:hypothetical protein